MQLLHRLRDLQTANHNFSEHDLYSNEYV